ncbi:MAG: hypothetical protein K2M11_06265 [Paramuribaculum sp.]|nr:hypothetical protein [Paramuribaculum sp.]
MLKKFLCCMMLCGALSASAQIMVDLKTNPEDPIGTNRPIVVKNNGRLLTKKGASLLKEKHLMVFTVTGTDTLLLTLKPEAMELLDADKKGNYQPVAKPKKSQKQNTGNSRKK